MNFGSVWPEIVKMELFRQKTLFLSEKSVDWRELVKKADFRLMPSRAGGTKGSMHIPRTQLSRMILFSYFLYLEDYILFLGIYLELTGVTASLRELMDK